MVVEVTDFKYLAFLLVDNDLPQELVSYFETNCSGGESKAEGSL